MPSVWSQVSQLVSSILHRSWICSWGMTTQLLYRIDWRGLGMGLRVRRWLLFLPRAGRAWWVVYRCPISTSILRRVRWEEGQEEWETGKGQADEADEKYRKCWNSHGTCILYCHRRVYDGTNQLAIQGVDYDADAEGFLGGGGQEGANMILVVGPYPDPWALSDSEYRASLINGTQSHCPNAPLIFSGYSQGAQLVHLATTSLPASSTSKLASIVLFGDPKNGTAVPNIDSKRVWSICHAGDQICQGKDHVRSVRRHNGSFQLRSHGSWLPIPSNFWFLYQLGSWLFGEVWIVLTMRKMRGWRLCL